MQEHVFAWGVAKLDHCNIVNVSDWSRMEWLKVNEPSPVLNS